MTGDHFLWTASVHYFQVNIEKVNTVIGRYKQIKINILLTTLITKKKDTKPLFSKGLTKRQSSQRKEEKKGERKDKI